MRLGHWQKNKLRRKGLWHSMEEYKRWSACWLGEFPRLSSSSWQNLRDSKKQDNSHHTSTVECSRWLLISKCWSALQRELNLRWRIQEWCSHRPTLAPNSSTRFPQGLQLSCFYKKKQLTTMSSSTQITGWEMSYLMKQAMSRRKLLWREKLNLSALSERNVFYVT